MQVWPCDSKTVCWRPQKSSKSPQLDGPRGNKSPVSPLRGRAIQDLSVIIRNHVEALPVVLIVHPQVVGESAHAEDGKVRCQI